MIDGITGFWLLNGSACLLGVVFTTIGLKQFLRARELSSRSQIVEVEVVDLVKSTGPENETLLSPRFQIVSGDHAGHSSTSKWASNLTSYTVGDRTMGIFDEQTGEVTSLDRNRTESQFALLFLGLGACCFVLIAVLQSNSWRFV